MGHGISSVVVLQLDPLLQPGATPAQPAGVLSLSDVSGTLRKAILEVNDLLWLSRGAVKQSAFSTYAGEQILLSFQAKLLS